MGRIGEAVGGYLGRTAGRLGARMLGRQHGKCGAQLGGAAGQALGKLSPFKKGGRVRKTGPALVHKGEYILPKGVKPTKKQMKKVAKKGGKK